MLVYELQKIDSCGWFTSVSPVCDSPDTADVYGIWGQAGNTRAMQSHMETLSSTYRIQWERGPVLTNPPIFQENPESCILSEIYLFLNIAN